ncbi:hypothetical protein E2C01_051688 [Portunus trituberculatus]|uniref:Secreted protein n=1 Tax=Portunus trituberculatus TaxID=210409 RepID=A0A5B7GFJ8_PORTR|nr:hypothetical protein [Portunus trituberculatus]
MGVVVLVVVVLVLVVIVRGCCGRDEVESRSGGTAKKCSADTMTKERRKEKRGYEAWRCGVHGGALRDISDRSSERT